MDAEDLDFERMFDSLRNESAGSNTAPSRRELAVPAGIRANLDR